jgi:predicted HAD superfamily Cof-like phosphohydrolase
VTDEINEVSMGCLVPRDKGCSICGEPFVTESGITTGRLCSQYPNQSNTPKSEGEWNEFQQTEPDEFQKLVHDFDVTMGCPADVELRVSLIQEEAKELKEGIQTRNTIGVIDALCDLLYVVYGAGDVFDIPLGPHRSGSYLAEIQRQCRTDKEVSWESLEQYVATDRFDNMVQEVAKTLRLFQQFNAKGRLKSDLERLVRDLWLCGAEAVGVDLRPFFREVHRTNMHKLTGPKRADGKQLKPEGWLPPRIEAMYNRFKVGNAIFCESKCCGDVGFQQPHPQGGLFCGHCGGLFVEVGS